MGGAAGECRALGSVLSQWGELACHAPILLAWAVFKFVSQPEGDLDVRGCHAPKTCVHTSAPPLVS